MVQSVWPAIEIKSSPIFSKVCPKCSHSSFYLRRSVFQYRTKSLQVFGLLLIQKIVVNIFQKLPTLVTLIDVVNFLWLTAMAFEWGLFSSVTNILKRRLAYLSNDLGIGQCLWLSGRVVASNSRGPRFGSSHWQKNKWILFPVNWIEKTKIIKKRPWMAHFLTVERQQYRNVTFQSDYMLGRGAQIRTLALVYALRNTHLLFRLGLCCQGSPHIFLPDNHR